MRVEWVLLRDRESAVARVGDLVSADAGGLPTYRILALEDGWARLRDEQHQLEQVSSLSAFRWRAVQA